MSASSPMQVDLPTTLRRRVAIQEIWLVLALSVGASALLALVQLLADLTSGRSLAGQTAQLNTSAAPGRPWLDLALQLIYLGMGFVPVLLVAHLLGRTGEAVACLGLDRTQPARDLARGSGLAVLVGGSGLLLYLGSHAAGAALTVVPESLPPEWWRLPVLVLSAVQNAMLEEVLVVGYLMRRLRQLGWTDGRALALSAGLRASYHLYQGFGGFVGNLIMGLLFGRLYQRSGRIAPLVIAHTLIDVAAFVGYALLVGRLSWLPAPG